MSDFGSDTIGVMRTVLDEVCSHIPRTSTDARTFVASRILECASKGDRSYDGLLRAGRRAVIEKFGTIEAVRTQFAARGVTTIQEGLGLRARMLEPVTRS